MANEFKLPNLGEGVASGDVVGVSVKIGDSVSKGSSLCEIETNKAVMDVTANFSGKITAVNVKVGDTVKPGHPVVAYEASGGSPLPQVTAAPASLPASVPVPPEATAKVAVGVPVPRPLSQEIRAEPHRGIGLEEASKIRVAVIGAGPGVMLQHFMQRISVITSR